MAIQYKRGYGPHTHTRYTPNILFSPIWRETRGIKVPVEEEPNQLPLTLTVCFRSPPLRSSLLLRELSWKLHSGIPNTLILNIVDKSNMSYIRSYSCSMFCLLPLLIHNCWICFIKSVFKITDFLYSSIAYLKFC